MLLNAGSQREPSTPCISGLELQEKIGEGGMGVVYRAIHLNLQRSVAVKVLRSDAGDCAALPPWQRESRLMAALAHPNVVTIHDAGQAGGHSYLVLEYLAGGSLRSRMQPGKPWALADAALVLDRVADSLCHIHAQGVLHLDLKPENVLYTSDGRIKITDFGLSVRSAQAEELVEGRGYQGTVDYCPPEQRFGLALDARCDVFALAALAYELLSGRPPGRVYVPISRRRPGLPAALDDVLRRGLARDPSDRYQSMDQFRQALADGCRAARPRTWAWRTAAAAGLAVLTAALLGVYMRRKTVPPALETSAAPAVSPIRSWVLYDRPKELKLFAAKDGAELPERGEMAVQRVWIEDPKSRVPADLALPDWPTCRPVLAIRSPRAWGFVHPLADRTLGERVLENWPELLERAVPAEKNFVKAGGFEEDCLSTDHRGKLWRAGNAADWTASRQISLDRPRDQPNNRALVLTNLDPARSKEVLGCYQPLEYAPPPGAVTVLRYRARSATGKGCLQVYASVPLLIPESESGGPAGRIRSLCVLVPANHDNSLPNRWLFHVSVWVIPTLEWQTYLVIYESPPYPTQNADRKLVIGMCGTDRIRVDDVALFLWEPKSKP
jgi:hypothetical protein